LISEKILFLINTFLFEEGENRKEKEKELKLVMKKLEQKYAPLQVVPVIEKIGTDQVSSILFNSITYIYDTRFSI
jgi:hypothetical protein